MSGRPVSWARWWRFENRRRNEAALARHASLHPVLRRCAALLLTAWLTMLAAVAVLMFLPSTARAQPAESQRYRLTLAREAQLAWGLQAPLADFAGQVHQESRWNPEARSPVGAQGLAQFMPSTASWIGGVYPSLGERAPANPTWALRALVTYDRWLFDRIKAEDACERLAFALSAYNGGLGWVFKRQAQSPTPGRCLAATCLVNPGVHPASQRENERYPELILHRWSALYEAWGPRSCSP